MPTAIGRQPEDWQGGWGVDITGECAHRYQLEERLEGGGLMWPVSIYRAACGAESTAAGPLQLLRPGDFPRCKRCSAAERKEQESGEA